MKILFVIRSLGIGGAEGQLLNLAKGLRRRGHEPTVASLYSGGGGALETDFRSAGLRVRSLGKVSRWGVARPVLNLVGLVRRDPPDVLHGYLTAGNLLALAARPFVRRAILVWGMRASDVDVPSYGSFVRATTFLERRLASRADRIIVNSAAGRRHALALGYPDSVLRVVQNGIDTDRFRPDQESRLRIRRRWGVKEEDRVVGVIGRIDPMKGHSVFLKAAALLSTPDSRFRFVCVGDGPSRETTRLRQLTAELSLEDRVRWYPAERAIEVIYNGLDLLCSTSVWGEGFPNVVAEAMACGIPCVVTDVGDSARTVSGIGSVVEPGDPQVLAAAIAAAFRAEARPPKIFRTRIVDTFGIERLAESTEQVLAEALEAERA